MLYIQCIYKYILFIKYIYTYNIFYNILLAVQMVKNSPSMQPTWVQFLGQEDPLEKVNGKRLQYSCLENRTDRGAWWATVLADSESQTRLSY